MAQQDGTLVRETELDPTNAGRRPRVAVVYHFFPHYRRAVFKELLSSRDFEFEIYYGENRVADTINTVDGIYGTVKLPIFKFGPFFWQSGLLSLLARERHDAIIFLGDYSILSYWFAAASARMRGACVLFWTIGWHRDDKGLAAFARKSFYRLADGLLLYGPRAKEIGVKKGFAADRMTVIYNSLDYETQRGVRERLEAEGTTGSLQMRFNALEAEVGGVARPYVLYIGRLLERVRLDLAVRALQRSRINTGRDLPLVLLGDGPASDQLAELAAKSDIRAVFLGANYDEEVIGPWIYHARVVLGPGKAGLTVMHALAYGVPVITHDNLDRMSPESEAIVPGITGEFFHDGDAEHLAKVLEGWLKKPRTAEERAAAIRTIETKYNPGHQANLIESAVRRFLSRK